MGHFHLKFNLLSVFLNISDGQVNNKAEGKLCDPY